jgi:hypothetical protein
MLGAFKRWIGARRDGPDGRALVGWARDKEFVAKRVRDGDGLVVEGHSHQQPWRMEWGNPQRGYILERELRIRMELGLPSSLQMLLTSRELAEQLEADAFAIFTQDMQTRIDSSMPEEMRWLTMFPKAQIAPMKSLRTRFVAVASAAAPLNHWLEGEFAQQLESASRTWLSPDTPLVLMTLRGRLYLRLEALQPTPAMLDGVLGIFEAAVHGAITAAESLGAPSGWHTTGSTAWQSHLPSELPPDLQSGDDPTGDAPRGAERG